LARLGLTQHSLSASRRDPGRSPVHPNPDLVPEIETNPAAWVLQDTDSASGYLTRFVDLRPTANRSGDSDGAARRPIL
jgi:hypothetical protein